MLRRFIFKLLTPRRVSIAIDDLPLFGARGEAVRAHVLEAWWLSPAWVKFQGDRILAFGLWLPMDTGEPTSESHPDACGGDNKACHSEEPSENPVLSDVVGSKAPHVGVASPLPNTDHTATRCNDGGVGPVAADAREQCCCRNACDGVPPVQVLPDSRNIHRPSSPLLRPRVHTTAGTVVDDLARPVALIVLVGLIYALLVH